jgi:hypothetical protein
MGIIWGCSDVWLIRKAKWEIPLRSFPNKHELGLLKISIRELARVGLWRSKWLTVTLSLALCVGQRDKQTRQGSNHVGNQQSLDVRSTWAGQASRFAKISDKQRRHVHQ